MDELDVLCGCGERCVGVIYMDVGMLCGCVKDVVFESETNYFISVTSTNGDIGHHIQDEEGDQFV